jgi:DNA ligase-1
MTVINKLLIDLAVTSKATEKKTLLKESKDDSLVQEVLMGALNPYITYGVLPSDVPDPKEEYDILFEQAWLEVKALLEQLANRDLTGNAAREAVETHLKGVCGPALARILSKDLRCGIQAKTVNSVIKNFIPTFEVGLASEGPIVFEGELQTDVVLNYPMWAEPKYDGVRTITLINDKGEVEQFSRNGKPYENFPRIRKAVQALAQTNVMLDGEVAGEHFDDVMNVAHRKSGQDDEGLIYYVFDIMPLEFFTTKRTKLSQCDRRVVLADALSVAEVLPCIRLAPGRVVNNDEEMLAYFWEMRKAGFEGLVVKDAKSPYQFKRGTAWYKVKEWYSAEGPIVAVLEGTKKNKGKMGALAVEFDGVVTEVGSGFTDEMREDLWARQEELIGRVVEVKYQEKTKDGCLRFPIMLRFRPDKDES